MIYLNLALYSEGDTDDRFLATLIERTAEAVVLGCQDEPVFVLPIFLVRPYLIASKMDGDEELLQAARIACEHDILIVHKDADTQTHKEVVETRIDPGKELIRQATENGESACSRIVPIVPVKMMEAWLLADWQTVLEIAEADITPASLKILRAKMKPLGLTLPSKPHQAASVRDPKYALEQIVRLTRERRSTTLNALYETMGSAIKMETLERTTDYTKFVEDLKAALIGLGKIRLQT